jgi:hypothetical protein
LNLASSLRIEPLRSRDELRIFCGDRPSSAAAGPKASTSDTISKIVTCEQQRGALGTTQLFAYCAQKVAGVYVNVSRPTDIPANIDPYINCLARYGQNVENQHGTLINMCIQESDRIVGSNTTTVGRNASGPHCYHVSARWELPGTNEQWSSI